MIGVSRARVLQMTSRMKTGARHTDEAQHPGFEASRDAYLIQYYGLKVVHFTDKEITALTGWPKKKKASA